MTAAKCVRITFNVDIEVPPLVLGDRARLDQVLCFQILFVADSKSPPVGDLHSHLYRNILTYI